MKVRFVSASCAVMSPWVIGAAVIAAPVGAQTSYRAPRTAQGYPDFQGVWTNATITPLERSAELGARRAYTPAEAKTLEQATFDANAAADQPTDPKATVHDVNKNCEVRGFSGVSCGYNAFWVDPGTKLIDINGEKRTSIIVDPPDGRIPAVLPSAQARAPESRASFNGAGPFDGPEARSLGERCILSFGSSAGPPMLPLLYNNNYQIVQTKDTVMIHVEMVHDARIVRIGGKPRPAKMVQWMGDSIGRYEGDTLIVETSNFPAQQSFRGASESRKVIERFTRIAPNKILYRFTVEDPAAYAQSFSGELAFNTADGNIYEYACHEGNYALPGILAGARAAEHAAAAATKQ